MAERDDPPPRGSYRREGSGLEFDRVSFFTDAVYAIAMTLLVVELHVPHIVGTIGEHGYAGWTRSGSSRTRSSASSSGS